MRESLSFKTAMARQVPDPSIKGATLGVFADGLGQDGRPFVALVSDPPNATRGPQRHHGDVLIAYVSGEQRFEDGEVYRAGDLRWVSAGHNYGPAMSGPHGAGYWMISQSNPTPVAAETPTESVEPSPYSESIPELPKPYDWRMIDELTRTSGAVILKGFLPSGVVDQLNADIDRHLSARDELGAPRSSSEDYNAFQGYGTTRVHGLSDFSDTAAAVIAHDDIVDWAERLLAAKSQSILLNAALLLQVNPGEHHQYLHNDAHSWPELPTESDTLIVNAMYALDDFTEQNGATFIAPGSWSWDKDRHPHKHELTRAYMERGDVLLFRADLIHGAGANRSSDRRRGLSVTYCAGWLRPVENSFLNVRPARLKDLPKRLLPLLGYGVHDASAKRGGLIGLYNGGDPADFVATLEAPIL
jgi:Phytanoyl-CoA dioxygenase (PhyH)